MALKDENSGLFFALLLVVLRLTPVNALVHLASVEVDQ
ncbi:hypothetical protein FHY22_001937 [Xanthomonas arboricola]|nr:hypothetical protein [Xanthomonas arboricola]